MMLLPRWDKLPLQMRTEEVRPYYEILRKKRMSLVCKRVFDIVVSLIMLVAASPLLLVLSIAVKCDSHGPVLFRQERVTRMGKVFRICKFRTMVTDAERLGALVTTDGDARVTRVGHLLRRLRLDEVPQLWNVLTGDMTFVGTRPEVLRYVARYTPVMYATLLLPSGVTSEASIRYKDEARLLSHADDADEVYVQQVLPGKMVYNLESLEKFSFAGDCRTMWRTVRAVFRSDDV